MSQEFDNKVLDLVKQKGFYPYEYLRDFEKFKKKETFYSSSIGKKVSHKEYKYVLKIWDKFKMKMMKDYHDLYLKCD